MKNNDEYISRTPDQILEKLKAEEESGSGKLKIFFGYIAGVGKTYAMLEAAHEALAEGKDVVLGYIEPHARPETAKLTEGLEKIPTKSITYRGITLQEFDLDAAIKRHPEIILVDELAHTNVKGSRHTKRYQDVEELLKAGIDVYTTLNVQHLETLNDVVQGVTGIAVNERIPDYIFDNADKVEIIDIEPEELIKRLNEGKIYKNSQVNRALNNFFTKENLASLREIALRRTADRLNKTKTKQGADPSKIVDDNLLVCLSSAPSNAKVIRAAARMSEAFHSKFTALYVETPDDKTISKEDYKRLKDNIRLAEQLGAEVTVLYGYDPATQIASYAKLSGITKIILGRSKQVKGIIPKSTLADKLIKQMGDIDIYFIPDDSGKSTKYKKKKFSLENEVSGVTASGLLKMFAIIAIATVIGFIFYNAGFREANIITVYILGTLIISMFIPGNLYGFISSVIIVLAFNFFFTEPRYSLEFYDPEYFVTFIIVFIASIISSTLAIRVRNQAKQFSERAYYTELLMQSTQRMMVCEKEEDILKVGAEQVYSLLNRPVAYSLIKNGNELDFYEIRDAKHQEKISLTKAEKAVANWVVRNNKHAGASTNTLSNVGSLFMAIRGSSNPVGIVAVPIDNYRDMTVLEKNLMISILNDCGLILERRMLMNYKQKISFEAEQEKWKSNMLGTISHDFRTPLTSISGNATILMDKKFHIDEEKKYELYEDIYDDAMWLYNLTENLLYITRMSTDSIKLNMDYELISDIFSEALMHVDRQKKYYDIEVVNEDEYLMAKMEPRLIIQVIINIVNNAIKYTPKGTKIVLKSAKYRDMALITIADSGEGISDEVKEHLFEMFYSAKSGKNDSKRGHGLGLSLCKTIVEAHGGTISVYDNEPHGTVFAFTLPAKEVKID